MGAEADGNSGQEARPDSTEPADAGGSVARSARTHLLTPAIGASMIVLLISATASLAWVVGHGGVALPARPTAGAVAGASVAPPTASPGPPSTPGPSAAGSAPSPSPATSGPSAPTATPGPPSFPPAPAPSSTSDRYAVLVPCPATPSCYRYTVRRGDNLWSIARWFGVPLETVHELNPGLQTTTLRPGMELTLPPPTR